jgi:glycosyltransferase involved in cell wall biosynthesis
MLHVTQTIASLRASLGGPSRTVVELSKALGQRVDTKVSIVTADRAAAGELEALSTRLAASAPISIRATRGVLDGLRALAQASTAMPSVIHDNGAWLYSNVQAALAARALRIPAVVSPQGCLEPWCMAQRRWRKQAAMLLYQRWCLRNATALHATSELEARNIRALGIRQPIAVVSNGIEPPPPATAQPEQAHRIALFLSRLHKKKGLLELIEAWAAVRPPGWVLRIVGPDDGYRQNVIDAVAKHGLHSDVELHGEVDNEHKWHHYRQAQLFVLPTYTENFGLVIGEALACGVPVITTTETPWAQIAERGCGWIVPPGGERLRVALAAATALSAERLAQMGASAVQWIPSEFSWSSIAARMRLLYGWIAAGASRSQAPAFVMVD